MFFNSNKCKFQVVLQLHDLTNIPYVSGLYYAKYKLKSGGSGKGSTHRATVKDHCVTWNSEFILTTTVSVGRDHVLNPCELQLSIKQEANEGNSTEKVGTVLLNLSEFAGERMITIDMKLLKGDPSFLVPRSSFGEEAVDIDHIASDGLKDLTLSRALEKEKIPSALDLSGRTNDAHIVNEIFANSSKSSTYKSNASK